MTATVVNLRTGDKDAITIGKLCAKARGSMVDSVRCLIEAGQKLVEKKKEVGHGGWMPWLKENADALGFSGKNTAAKLMKAATIKIPVNGEFSEAEASQISKSVWGNIKSKKKRSVSPDQEDKAREIVRPLVATGERLCWAELEKQHGIGHGTLQKAARIETILLNETIDPNSLSRTANEKLEIAKRVMRRKLEAEYTVRMHGIDEEVRQRVLASNKEYLDRLNAKEEKADRTIALYQEWTNNRKPLFTVDQFKTILMCLHPDGQRTAIKLADAFRLFNSKKFQLTGEK